MAPVRMMDHRTKSKSEQVLAKEGGHVSSMGTFGAWFK
jgi:hypothetical protein